METLTRQKGTKREKHNYRSKVNHVAQWKHVNDRRTMCDICFQSWVMLAQPLPAAVQSRNDGFWCLNVDVFTEFLSVFLIHSPPFTDLQPKLFPIHQLLFSLSETDQADTESTSIPFLSTSLLIPGIFFQHPLTLSVSPCASCSFLHQSSLNSMFI